MEIRIGIQQSVRELMVEIDDEKAQAKAKAAAAGRRQDLTEDDLRKRVSELAAAAAQGQEEVADSESADEDVKEE